MNPVLFQFQTFTIYTFGFAITIATLVSAFLLWRRLKRFGYEDEPIIDMVLLSGFVALLLSRLFYVVQHWNDFSGSFLKIVLITYFPGLDGIGALVGIIAAVSVFTFFKRWNPLIVLDSVFYSMGLGVFITMLGSFFSGSLPGTLTGSSFGVLYPGLTGIRHPVPLYWMLISIIYFIVIVYVDKLNQKRGLISSIFLLVFSLALFLLQFVTDDNLKVFSVPLSSIISVMMFVFGGALLYLILKRKKSTEVNASPLQYGQ